MESLVPQLLEQGVIVLAFAWLLKHTLDTSKSRENRLMDFIESMKEELNVISTAITKLGDDVEEVKSEIRQYKKSEE